MCHLILEKLYYHGLRLSAMVYYLQFLAYFGLFFNISTSLYQMRWILCTIIIIYDLLLKA